MKRMMRLGAAALLAIGAAGMLGLPSASAAPIWPFPDAGVGAWGRNTNGQIGNNSTTDTNTPVVTTNDGVLTDQVVTAVSGGNFFTCAVASAKAYCWGSQSNGRVGNGVSSGNVTTPVAVTDTGVLAGKTITSISAGGNFACALDSAGLAYCWGGGTSGQLGNNGSSNSTVPVAVTMPSGKTFTSISAGGTHACAMTADSLAYCWGANSFGQVGTGSTSASVLVPTAVSGIGTVASISAGFQYSCAVSSGAAYCWGQQEGGKLGNGQSGAANVATPTAVDATGVLNGVTLTKIGASGTQEPAAPGTPGVNGFTCALASGANMYCWGYGVSGRLGNSASNSSTTPVAVTLESGVLQGKTVSSFAVGFQNTCVSTTEYKAYCWGFNSYGGLGNGNNIASNKPVAISSGALVVGSPPVARPVMSVSVGNSTSMAVFGWNTMPGMPGTPAITGSSPNRTLSWTAPLYTGTSALATYTVWYKPTTSSNYKVFATLPSSSTSINLDTYASSGCPAGGTCPRLYGALTGQSYDWKIAATNDNTGRLSLPLTNVWTP